MATTDTYEWRLVGTGLTEGSTDVILPIINSHLYYVINDSGSGELTIPLDSVAAGLVTEGMLAVLHYRGSIRGSFIIENIKATYVSDQEYEGQVLSISGLGGMSMLDRAIIWNDGTLSSTRTFTDKTKAEIFATLIDEAQARGGLPFLTYDFDAINDSDSVAWTDIETYTLNVGMTLLELLHEFAKTGTEFDVTYSGSGFVLSAYQNGIGSDVSSSAFFRTGSNCTEFGLDQRGNNLKNALLVAFQDGSISLTDSASISTYGRREKLLDAGLAQTSASATTYAAAILSTSKDPEAGRVVKVYDGIAPFLFVDYGMGDTISIDNGGVKTSDRILGIQCDFNHTGYSNVTLELNSLILEQNLRMRQDIDGLLSDWQTARDSSLLAVSYWAAIGNSNIAITSTADMLKIGSKLYTLSTSAGGWLLSYDTTTGAWDVLVGVGAINTPLVMTSVGTDIYIGGFHAVYKYATATGTLTNIGLVVYGDPATEAVWAMGASGTDIYVSGVFDSIDGVAASDLAKYDTLTDTWTAGFGSGVTGVAQVILAVGSDIYMGGSFTAVDGVAASKIAKWNGTTWSALGSGLDFTVYTLAEYGANILAGGGFTGGISEWDGSGWAVFGGGISSGFVYKIAVYLTDVYIVGTFTDLGNRIAKYSGGSWWLLGAGLDNTVLDMVLFDDDVYVGGTFTTAGDKPAVGVAAYFSNFEALADYLENSSSSFNMGAAIHAAAASAITDSDEVPFWEDVTNALRKITWANIKATLKTYFDTLYVALTGNQTIAGVKTFSSDPIIPDEVYDATAWNGSLEPPTKNAVRDKIETVGLPAGSNLQVQINNSGVFGADDEFEYTLGGQIISLGRKSGAEASAVWSWATGGVSFHNLASWGTGVYSSMRGILARGTKASPTATMADDVVMRYRGSGYDGVGLVLSSATDAEVRVVNNENHDASHHGARIEIWTTPNASGAAERNTATVESNGDFNLEVSGAVYRVNGVQYGRETLTANRTYYVRTDGSDSNTGLTDSAGGAFLTVQKAVDIIAGLDCAGYTVTISIGGGTFAENISINGNRFIGLSSLTITGTLTTLESLTCGTGSVAGATSTQGTVVRNSGTWMLNERQDKIIRFTSGANNGLSRIVDSNIAGDTATIVAGWTGAPASGDTFVVEDWGTIIQSITISNSITVLLNAIKVGTEVATNSLVVSTKAVASISICWIHQKPASSGIGLQPLVFSNCVLSDCYLDGGVTNAGDYPMQVQASRFNATRTKFFCPSKTKGRGLWYDGQGGGFMTSCVIDGGLIGIYVAKGSTLTIVSGVYTVVRNCAVGVRADLQSSVVGTANTVYSGNTTDETATAASYGYID